MNVLENLNPVVVRALKWKLGDVKLNKLEEQVLAVDYYQYITGKESPLDDVIAKAVRIVAKTAKKAAKKKAKKKPKAAVVVKEMKKPAERSSPKFDKPVRSGLVRLHSKALPTQQPSHLIDAIMEAMGDDECAPGTVINRFAEAGWKAHPDAIRKVMIKNGKGASGLLKKVRHGIYAVR